MSRYHGNVERCSTCGMAYRNLHTGLTYAQVHDLLKDYSDDASEWTYKRRHTVLGKWFQIKQELWKEHQRECALQREFEETGRAALTWCSPSRESESYLDSLFNPLPELEEPPF